MARAGNAIFLVGPYRGGDFSAGVDTPAAVASLPRGYSGGVLTNEIEMVSRAPREHEEPAEHVAR